MDQKRILRVTGKGQMNVKPDMMRITVTIEGTYWEYDETLRASSRETEQLEEILAVHGFERSDLKTLQFDVNAEYEGYEENDVYKSRFAGYKFRHIMKLEFDSDNDRLGKILHALANGPVRPEFSISYTIKDREATKNKLLGKAMTDAKAKAVVLSQAAEVKLGDIQSIDYSWGDIDFEFCPMNKFMTSESCSFDARDEYALDIEPDDIEVSDTVTVVWEIR